MRETERRARLVEHLRVPTAARAWPSCPTTSASPRRRSGATSSAWLATGRLVRTYGGAALHAGLGRLDRPRSAPRREASHRPCRRTPASPTTTTIAIGSGSTALAFAREIADRRLTVITNALDVANVLLDRDGIELIVLGGVVRPRMHSMLGHLAELSSQELRADTLFMGIGAISLEQGLMNDSVPEILTDRALRRMSRSVVVLADASKFQQVAPGYVFGLDEVELVITDEGTIPVRDESTRSGDGASGSRWPDDRGHRPARDPRGPGRDPRDRRRAPEPGDIATRWMVGGVRRIHVIGNGTSYHSSLAAATLYRHRAGPGRPGGRSR